MFHDRLQRLRIEGAATRHRSLPPFGTRPSGFAAGSPIARTRRATLAAYAAALLTIPLALALLGGDDDPPGTARRHLPGGPATPSPSEPTRLRPPGAPVPPDEPPWIREARETVERLRALDDDALRRIARAGPTTHERLVAVNTLWSRGAHAEVEALVASADDRALTAKLAALRARRE